MSRPHNYIEGIHDPNVMPKRPCSNPRCLVPFNQLEFLYIKSQKAWTAQCKVCRNEVRSRWRKTKSGKMSTRRSGIKANESKLQYALSDAGRKAHYRYRHTPLGRLTHYIGHLRWKISQCEDAARQTQLKARLASALDMRARMRTKNIHRRMTG